MTDLQHYQAKICYTAAALTFHQDRVLLIKHKKLGIWLAPGGHIEENELPHLAAQREVLEETGLKVKVIDTSFSRDTGDIEYLPSPFITSLHWVCQQNYEARQENPEGYKPIAPWHKGCEQHIGYLYLAEPIGDTEPRQNVEETDGIDWFSKDQINDLETSDDIKAEIFHGFSIMTSDLQV